MKKRFSKSIVLAAMVLAISFVVFPLGSVFAEIADGSYEVNYEMKEKSSDSTSISDGYFSKPATVTVKDGVKTIQITVTSSSMIKSLSAAGNQVQVVSEDKDNDTRTVKFTMNGDLSAPISMNMHIVVPDMPAMPGGYEQDHVARAVFDVSGLPEASDTPTNNEDNKDSTNGGVAANDSNAGSNPESADGGTEAAVDNPQTGDSTSISLYVVLLLASVGVFVIYRLRASRN